jgi:hypothetical protein
MPLWLGDESKQAKGLPQMQNQVGCEEIKEGLNRSFRPKSLLFLPGSL